MYYGEPTKHCHSSVSPMHKYAPPLLKFAAGEGWGGLCFIFIIRSFCSMDTSYLDQYTQSE